MKKKVKYILIKISKNTNKLTMGPKHNSYYYALFYFIFQYIFIIESKTNLIYNNGTKDVEMKR